MRLDLEVNLLFFFMFRAYPLGLLYMGFSFLCARPQGF